VDHVGTGHRGSAGARRAYMKRGGVGDLSPPSQRAFPGDTRSEGKIVSLLSAILETCGG
jgi:hypothetical protein